jgi:hypothetical protein
MLLACLQWSSFLLLLLLLLLFLRRRRRVGAWEGSAGGPCPQAVWLARAP